MLHGIDQTILLIEANASLRRLIALGLQYRGLQVIEAGSLEQLAALDGMQPDLVLLDVDGEAASDRSLLAAAQAHPILSAIPMVVLAWDCVAAEGMAPTASQAQVTWLTKPFDARTLHAAIEQVLLTTKEVIASKKQEVFLATHSTAPAPSIWPLVTAIGLLLAVIGLMIQITLTAMGLLVVIAALLLWTLGTKPEQQSLAVEMP